MASKQKTAANAAAPSTNKFAETIFKISHRFSLFTVFDDFLTMSIAACTQNLATKKSWYEDDYNQAFEKYKDSELRHEIPNAFANLILEMEERTGTSLGNDVLGDFYEQHISNGRNGQYFTPYPICQFMASIAHTDYVCDFKTNAPEPLKILDPACGSGRMLLAAHKTIGPGHEYYGIDIDCSCVKMTALNLLLNGMWNSEVMCANSLMPDDFVISYRISHLPLGIFKVEDKEQSRLWHLHRNSFNSKKKERKSDDIILNSTPFDERQKDDSIQLDLF